MGFGTSNGPQNDIGNYVGPGSTQGIRSFSAQDARAGMLVRAASAHANVVGLGSEWLKVLKNDEYHHTGTPN